MVTPFEIAELLHVLLSCPDLDKSLAFFTLIRNQATLGKHTLNLLGSQEYNLTQMQVGPLAPKQHRLGSGPCVNSPRFA